MPAISVVIPLFNKANSISRAIESVLEQKFTDFELIIVNDGSTDASLFAIEVYKDTRIKIFTQPNQGAAVARNNGVNAASSQYVAFLDADDCYHPEFLFRIVSLIKRDPDAALYSCRFNLTDETGNTFMPQSHLSDDFVGLLKPFLFHFKLDRTIIHPSSMAVKKELFLRCGGFPKGKKVGEDILLILNLSLLGKVLHDHRVSATVHRDAENRTHHQTQPEPACHLTHFLTNDSWKQNLTKSDVDVIYDFIDYNALLHTAGAALLGHRKLARYYASLLWSHNIKLGFVAYCLSITPKPALQWLKKRRNSG